MAATLSLDTLTSGGSGITVLAGKTLTVEGVSVTAGSTNVQRSTTDVTIGTTAGYEVAGKSEVVVAANAASSNRTITLPAVGAVGMSTCIITVVADADATSTYKLMVQDAGTTEVWTGYQTGDFVRLIVSNSAWVVLDHKETMFSSRVLTADQSVAGSASTKIIGFTSVSDIGGIWDNTNNKLVSPFAGIWDINWRLGIGSATAVGLVPEIRFGGSLIYSGSQGSDAGGYAYGKNMASIKASLAASTDIEFYFHNMYSVGPYSAGGNASNETGFDAKFTRTY
jgi:hypothetical protein